MEVKGSTYCVVYDPAKAAVLFQGSLRLQGMTDYEPIRKLLDEAVAASPGTAVLDLRGLEFLNSAGINLLFGFVIRMRDQARGLLVVNGSARYPWQERSLRNLQKLMPGLRLEWV